MGVAVDVEAEELAVFGVGAEDGADGVVGADLFEADAHAGDVAAVDFGSVADLGDVGSWRGRGCRGRSASRAAPGVAEELGGELEDAAGVGDDLHGLDAGDLVEEPAAGGVHELGVALELEEFEDGDALVGVRVAGGVLGEEAVGGGGGAIEDDVDVGVAGGPEVFEEGSASFSARGAVASRRKSRASRRGPRHSWFQPGLPPLQPQLERQRSTPWKQDQEVSSATSASHCGREDFEELAVVGELGVACCLRSSAWRRRGPSRRACGGGRSFRRRWRRGRAGRCRVGLSRVEAGEEAAGEVFAGVEQAFEGDGAGGGAVVEEDGDAAAFVELDEVGVGGVDGGVGGFDPGDRWLIGASGGGFGGRRIAEVGERRWEQGRTRAHWCGREDGELDAFLRP